MPINVFGNRSSNKIGNQKDISVFVQKPYLRTDFLEANTEDDIDLKNQNRIKNLPFLTSTQEAASNNYVDEAIILGVNESLLLRLNPNSLSKLDERDYTLLDSTLTSPRITLELSIKNCVDKFFNDSSILKNSEHIDLNDRNITNARFIQVNQWPQIDSHLTAKLYVDTAIDEPSLFRYIQDNDFNNYNLTNINGITLKKKEENDNEVIIKAYVDQFHQENEQSGRDVGLDFYDESNDLVKNNQDKDLNDNKLTNLDSITVNRNPTSDTELSNKKHIDDEIDKNTILRFNQTLQNYLQVSVGNNTYNLTKYKKIQLTVTTINKMGNGRVYLLPSWRIFCNDKNNKSKITNFIRATKTKSPNGFPGAESLPPIGNAFMYIETSSNNHGENVSWSWERTDSIQISNKTFYYNRFSTTNVDKLKKMGRFRLQFLLDDNTWSTQYTFPKNTQNSDTSTDWSLINLDFTVENYCNKLIYDQIDTAHADICFSNITITHSVY